MSISSRDNKFLTLGINTSLKECYKCNIEWMLHTKWTLHIWLYEHDERYLAGYVNAWCYPTEAKWPNKSHKSDELKEFQMKKKKFNDSQCEKWQCKPDRCQLHWSHIFRWPTKQFSDRELVIANKLYFITQPYGREKLTPVIKHNGENNERDTVRFL